jgi:hypothetical protein
MEKKTLRHGFIYGFLAFYILYAITSIGMTGLLFSLAIGLIAFSFDISLEITLAFVILSGLLWKVVTTKKEGFHVPVGTGMKPKEIIRKIESIQNDEEPEAILSSSYAEGFENATNPSSPTHDSTAAPPPTGNSQPAKPTDSAATSELAKSLPTAGFSDKTTDGMFKLGQVPADVVGGAHIDIGTTMMNALNALKPDQVKQMTDDTRKLLETQKSLMGMLSSMKPMLQDGKQLMSTFNDMFGKGGVQGSA